MLEFSILYYCRTSLVVLMQTGGNGYRRLTCDQPVGLRHACCFLTVQDVVKVSY